MSTTNIQKLLGKNAKDLLTHKCKTIPKNKLALPNPLFVDKIFMDSDRNNRVLNNLHIDGASF